MVKTYGDLFLAARRALIASQGENAAPYARLLLSQLSGKTQAKLIADHSDPAPEALEEQLGLALDPETDAVEGVGIPFHAGAAAWYKQAGITVD